MIEPASVIEPVEILSVDWLDPRAAALRNAMDVEMTAVYSASFARHSPEARAVLGRAFAVDPPTIVGTLLATVGGVPVAQAGLRPHREQGALEVKKVIVDVAYRGRGISRLLMVELESVARALGATSFVLQTGDQQPSAISLYESLGYSLTAPYPPFELMPNALCYAKDL